VSMPETLELPPFVDLHTHLREPSSNKAETIENGTHAAGLGGFAVVADMPNNPDHQTWTRERLDEKIELSRRARVRIAFYAGSQPESDNIGELEAMAPDAIGLKLYGAPTTGNIKTYDAEDFREIVAEWHRVAPDKPIMFHAGENNLEEMIWLVADEYGHHLHICHVNDVEQVNFAVEAKTANLRVTSGVTPHHLLISEHGVETHGKFLEMQPPLANQDVASRLLRLLDNGVIDVIETDYAPHSKEAKLRAEDTGGHCFGLPGIEHVIPVLLYQVRRGNLSIDRLIDTLSTRPAEILGINLPAWMKTTWDTSVYRIENEDTLDNSTERWSPYLGYLAAGREIHHEVFTSRSPFIRRGETV
jgi:dihydroorotase